MIKKIETKEKKSKTVIKGAVKEKETKKEPAQEKPVISHAPEINPPTPAQNIGVREKDIKTPSVSAVKPQRVREDGGVKKEEKKAVEKKKVVEKKIEAPNETVAAPKPATEPVLKPDRYWEAVGRRKTAIARVRLYTKGDKGLVVNGKQHDVYFQNLMQRAVVEDALKKMKSLERFRMSAKVRGGGIHSQAEAIRHGISRALTKFNPDFRKRLRRAGFLTRDPRAKERKKFGLKKARRAPQWAKR